MLMLPLSGLSVTLITTVHCKRYMLYSYNVYLYNEYAHNRHGINFSFIYLLGILELQRGQVRKRSKSKWLTNP